MKKLLKLTLITVFSCILLNTVFANDLNKKNKTIKVTIGSNIYVVDDKSVQIDDVSYIQKDTNSTMIPLRFISNAFGVDDKDIQFDKNTKTITITNQNNVIQFFTNSNNYILNGELISKDINSPIIEIKNNRTFIPFNILADAFNLDYIWDANTKTATIIEKTINENNVPLEHQVLKYVNIARENQGLKPLKIDEKLSQIATLKAKDMVDNNYFSHKSPTYGDAFNMMKKFNINYQFAGENIAQGYESAKEVVIAWLDSPSHRENILNSNYNNMGLGYVDHKWVQFFTN